MVNQEFKFQFWVTFSYSSKYDNPGDEESVQTRMVKMDAQMQRNTIENTYFDQCSAIGFRHIWIIWSQVFTIFNISTNVVENVSNREKFQIFVIHNSATLGGKSPVSSNLFGRGSHLLSPFPFFTCYCCFMSIQVKIWGTNKFIAVLIDIAWLFVTVSQPSAIFN